MNGRNSGIVINPHYFICHQDTKTRTVNFINPGESRQSGLRTLSIILKNHLMDHIKSCDGIRLRLLCKQGFSCMFFEE
jgi:hypothetical protein